MIYLDNNATTMMHPDAISKMTFWCNRGNPSSGYMSAKAARAMMDELKSTTGSLVGVNVCCKEPRDGGKKVINNMYKIILCSGASEANTTAVMSIVNSYKLLTKKTPHVISSAVEHKSIMLLLEHLQATNVIQLTLIDPTPTGHIRPSSIQDSILPNTCLICVMHSNNETGAINNVDEIADIAHKANVAFHCDTVQSYGKVPFNASNIDSFTISYHKLGGPPGIGALAIKSALWEGYQLAPLIHGTQNEGLRGGTENLPGCGGALEGLKITFGGFKQKHEKVQGMKTYIMHELKSRIPCVLYKDYIKLPNFTGLVFLCNDSPYYLPNTILVSLVKQTGKLVCNVEMKNQLEAKGIIVSVGSACNTQSSKASHVIESMKADKFIKKGALRISLSYNNTMEECTTFIKEYLRVVAEQLQLK